MSLQEHEIDHGTADDWYFLGREPESDWSDPELWAGTDLDLNATPTTTS